MTMTLYEAAAELAGDCAHQDDQAYGGRRQVHDVQYARDALVLRGLAQEWREKQQKGDVDGGGGRLGALA